MCCVFVRVLLLFVCFLYAVCMFGCMLLVCVLCGLGPCVVCAFVFVRAFFRTLVFLVCVLCLCLFLCVIRVFCVCVIL